MLASRQISMLSVVCLQAVVSDADCSGAFEHELRSAPLHSSHACESWDVQVHPASAVLVRKRTANEAGCTFTCERTWTTSVHDLVANSIRLPLDPRAFVHLARVRRASSILRTDVHGDSFDRIRTWDRGSCLHVSWCDLCDFPSKVFD